MKHKTGGVSYCIQGNTIDRKIENGGNGKGVNEELAYTLNTIDRHAVMHFIVNDEDTEDNSVQRTGGV